MEEFWALVLMLQAFLQNWYWEEPAETLYNPFDYVLSPPGQTVNSLFPRYGIIRNINIAKLVDFVPALDTIVPMLRSFKGRVMFDVAADARLDSAMNVRIPTLRSAIHIKGDSLVLMDGETFAEISKMLMFKNKKENVFDSISVNVTVHDGNVTVYPFLVEIDRYKAAVGGEQGLDMNFNYHISILKSPLPFKAGVNISGNLDKMKFRIGKAKYKDAVTPAAVHRVDSTRMNMGNEIVNRFRRVVLGRQPR